MSRLSIAEDTETTICSSCGIAKESVTLTPAGICSPCDYDIRRNNYRELIGQLLVPESFSGPAIYAVHFDNGVKFGMTSHLNIRMREYRHAWSRPIVSVSALAIPRKRLKVAEQVALSALSGLRLRGEFCFDCTDADQRRAFEEVVIALYDELKLED